MSAAKMPILNGVCQGDFDLAGHKLLNADLSAMASGVPFSDAGALIKAAGDATKLAHFDLALVGTGTHRVFRLPNYNGQLATLAGVEALTNKTYNGITLGGTGGIQLSDAIVHISGELITSGNLSLSNDLFDLTFQTTANTSLILPTTGTLATTAQIPVISDTAYNATSWNANMDGATKNAIRDKFESLSSAMSLPFTDDNNIFANKLDPTKLVKLSLAGLTTSTTRTLAVPNKSGTLAFLDDIPFIAGILFGSDENDRSLSLAGNVAFYGEFTVAGGFGTLVNVTGVTDVTLPVSGTLVARDSADTLTNKTINGAEINDATVLSLQPEGTVHSLSIVPSNGGFTADRELTIATGNANRTLTLGGNLSTAASLTFAGAYAATLNFTGATTLSFPRIGLLVSKVAPPAANSSTGTAGQISYDSTYLYVCYDIDSWGRIAMDTSFP
jgi:hypothetical protein